MTNLNDYIGLLGCLLLMIALPLTVVRQPRFSRLVVMVTMLIMISLAIIPINDLIILAYVRGVTSDLSITSIILLSYFIAGAYSGESYISMTDKQTLQFVILITAILLYPFALGLGPWDSYATGYGSTWLYGLLLIVTFWLYIQQRLFIVGVILAGTMAYLFSLLASQNLWDYLIDPILVTTVLVQVAAKVFSAISRNQRTDSNMP